MRFYLGVHEPAWLARVDVPLFVSRRRLARRKQMPRARGPWALDSGGFSELLLYGEYRTSPEQYVQEVRQYRDEVGNLQWATIQDWMCEQIMLAKTGLSLQEHQRRTIASYHHLQQLAPEIPWVPVLQGWGPRDYFRHVDDYHAAGVNLAALPLVGIGSVCRRQNTSMVECMIMELAESQALPLHGFGMKLGGLRRAARWLTSADSMAWSWNARYGAPLPGCTHPSCCNCLIYALWWRERVLTAIQAGERPAQRGLFPFSEMEG